MQLIRQALIRRYLDATASAQGGGGAQKVLTVLHVAGSWAGDDGILARHNSNALHAARAGGGEVCGAAERHSQEATGRYP